MGLKRNDADVTLLAAQSSSFTLVGCYNDNANYDHYVGRVSSTATVAVCHSACSSYRYTMIEDGNECQCGNTLPPTQATLSDCSKNSACSVTNGCGNAHKASIYDARGAPPPPPLAPATLIGCFNDNANYDHYIGRIRCSSFVARILAISGEIK